MTDSAPISKRPASLQPWRVIVFEVFLDALDPPTLRDTEATEQQDV
jgi:hypothetical protein